MPITLGMQWGTLVLGRGTLIYMIHHDLLNLIIPVLHVNIWHLQHKNFTTMIAMYWFSLWIMTNQISMLYFFATHFGDIIKIIRRALSLSVFGHVYRFVGITEHRDIYCKFRLLVYIIYTFAQCSWVHGSLSPLYKFCKWWTVNLRFLELPIYFGPDNLYTLALKLLSFPQNFYSWILQSRFSV